MARPITPLNGVDKPGFDKFYAGPLGTELSHKCHLVKGIWDFSVDGGAVSTINLKDDDGNLIVIPSGAIVKQVFTREVTNITTSASGTLSVGLAAVDDLLTATAAATFANIQAGACTGSAATMVRMTADHNLAISIATGALTAGKLEVYVEFVYLP